MPPPVLIRPHPTSAGGRGVGRRDDQIPMWHDAGEMRPTQRTNFALGLFATLVAVGLASGMVGFAAPGDRDRDELSGRGPALAGRRVVAGGCGLPGDRDVSR